MLIFVFFLWVFLVTLCYGFEKGHSVTYWKNLLIGIGQLLNTLFGGYADESLSSRAYRLSLGGKWHQQVPRFCIDKLFFFNYEKRKMGCRWHCELAYINERERMQMPPEMR